MRAIQETSSQTCCNTNQPRDLLVGSMKVAYVVHQVLEVASKLQVDKTRNELDFVGKEDYNIYMCILIQFQLV